MTLLRTPGTSHIHHSDVYTYKNQSHNYLLSRPGTDPRPQVKWGIFYSGSKDLQITLSHIEQHCNQLKVYLFKSERETKLKMNLIILRQRWKGINISILWTAFKNQSLFLNRCLVLKEFGYFKSNYIYYFFERNFYPSTNISSAQQLSSVLLIVTPWTATPQASLSITNSQSLLKLMPIEWVMLSNQLILCCPRLLCLQFFPASGFFFFQ